MPPSLWLSCSIQDKTSLFFLLLLYMKGEHSLKDFHKLILTGYLLQMVPIHLQVLYQIQGIQPHLFCRLIQSLGNQSDIPGHFPLLLILMFRLSFFLSDGGRYCNGAKTRGPYLSTTPFSTFSM